jgi:hypothetical protein
MGKKALRELLHALLDDTPLGSVMASRTKGPDKVALQRGVETHRWSRMAAPLVTLAWRGRWN